MANDSQWPEVRLGDVAKEVTVGWVGPMTQEYRDAGVPFLRSLNIKPFRIERTDLRYISPEFHAKIAKSRLQPGDVVIVRTGDPGTAAVIPEWLADANCADLVIIRPGSGLDPRFLAYFVNAAAHHQISAHIVGAVQQHFNVGSAKELRLPLPDLWEQQAIARVLSTLDDKIELNRRMSHTLEGLARAMFQSWFVDFDPVTAKAAGREPVGMTAETALLFPDSFEDSPLGPIPKGWRAGKLGDIAINPRRGVDPADVEPATAYIGLEHMPRRRIALEDWGHSDGVASNKFRFQRGEILFGKLRPYFHKVGVAATDGVCSTDILVIMPRTDAWFGIVLGHTSSDELVQYVDAGSTGTKMPRTSWHDLARYEIVIPSEQVALAFDEKVRPMVKRMAASIHESRTLAALRDALLPRLLSGELRVTGAETEVEAGGSR
jgi:type I restriction enzyme S subunit